MALRLTTLLFAVCLLSISVQPSVANTGMENVAYGAKSAGMGGTAVAVGDDGTVMNVNPANIARIDGVRLDMGLEIMFPFFAFENGNVTGTKILNNTCGKNPVYLIPSGGLLYHKRGSK